MRSLLILIVLFSCTAVTRGSDRSYDFNARCMEAYSALLSLRIEEGVRLIEAEYATNPENLILVILQSYSECLPLLFNGDPADYPDFKTRTNKRLEALEQGDPASPWFLFSKALLNFHSAAVRIRFNDYLSGGSAFRRSYLQFRENSKKFPDFPYNQLFLGLTEALIGTVPDSYKWLSSLLGMQGDVRKGTAKVSALLSDKEAGLFREESIFYAGYLTFFLLSDKQAAWKLVERQNPDDQNNLVFTFMTANLALNSNRASAAERILRQRNTSPGYLEVPLLDYLTGLALLHKIDPEAPVYIRRFLRSNRGSMYVKDGWQKLSIYYQITGNTQQALTCKQKILQVGSSQIDADKQAQRYAENKQLPHPVLLKARYQCEGGYFSRALETLDPLRPSQLTEADQTEYFYRYGRAYALKGNFEGARPFYEKAITLGATRPEQFAARSALELAELYEDRGQASMAIRYYRKCLQMKNEDYKSSLDQRAKAGLNRLGGR